MKGYNLATHTKPTAFKVIVPGITSKLYSDNYLSIGFSPSQGNIGKSEKEYNRDYEGQWDSFEVVDCSYRGVERTTTPFFSGYKDGLNRLDKCQQSSQSKKRYGSGGISAKGKRALKSGSAVLQKRFGRSKLGFATLTLPNFTAPKLKYLSERWGDVVRVFYQKLRRLFDKVGCPQYILGCTEIQPKRYRNRGEICPHLHFVYVAKPPKSKNYYVTPKEVRRAWNSVLLHYLKRAFPITYKKAFMLASVKLQPIRKDITRYLGKYISKGGELVADIVSDGRQNELPRQWWTMSSLMRALYKASIVAIMPSLAWEMFKNPEEFLESGVFSWFSVVTVEINEEHRTVGLVAYLSCDDYRQGIVVSAPEAA